MHAVIRIPLTLIWRTVRWIVLGMGGHLVGTIGAVIVLGGFLTMRSEGFSPGLGTVIVVGLIVLSAGVAMSERA